MASRSSSSRNSDRVPEDKQGLRKIAPLLKSLPSKDQHVTQHSLRRYEFTFQLKAAHTIDDTDKSKLYCCDICHAIYRHAFSLKRHYLRMHINYEYLSAADLSNCCINYSPVLDSTQTNLSIIDIASQWQEDSPPSWPRLYRCQRCNVYFDEITGLKEHIENHSNNEKSTSLTIFCTQCPQRFSHKSDFNQHQAYHNNVKSSQCSGCNEEFPTSQQLKQHMCPKIISSNIPESISVDPFTSPAYVNSEELKVQDSSAQSFQPITHISCRSSVPETVPVVSPIPCSLPQQITPVINKSSLFDLPRPVPLTLTVRCSQCPAAFAHETDLSCHIKAAHTARPFLCALCSQRFATSDLWKEHVDSIHKTDQQVITSTAAEITTDRTDSLPQAISTPENSVVQINREKILSDDVATPSSSNRKSQLNATPQDQVKPFGQQLKVQRSCMKCTKKGAKRSSLCRHHRTQMRVRRRGRALRGVKRSIINSSFPTSVVSENSFPSNSKNSSIPNEITFDISIAQNIAENLTDCVDGKPKPRFMSPAEMKMQECERWLNRCREVMNQRESDSDDSLSLSSLLKSRSIFDKENDCHSEDFQESPNHQQFAQVLHHSSSPVTDNVKDQMEMPLYICEVCGERFHSLSSVSQHEANNHPNVKCSHIHFENGHKLPDHLFRPAQSESLSFSALTFSNKTYHCSKCSSVFSLMTDFHEHILQCGSSIWDKMLDSKIRCSQNNRKFPKTYRRSESTVNWVECPKSVSTGPSLVASISNSSRSCEACGKSFSAPWPLERHRRSCALACQSYPPPKIQLPTQDASFQCIHCSRRFSYESNLRRHKKECSKQLIAAYNAAVQNIEEERNENSHIDAERINQSVRRKVGLKCGRKKPNVTGVSDCNDSTVRKKSAVLDSVSNDKEVSCLSASRDNLDCIQKDDLISCSGIPNIAPHVTDKTSTLNKKLKVRSARNRNRSNRKGVRISPRFSRDNATSPVEQSESIPYVSSQDTSEEFQNRVSSEPLSSPKKQQPTNDTCDIIPSDNKILPANVKLAEDECGSNSRAVSDPCLASCAEDILKNGATRIENSSSSLSGNSLLVIDSSNLGKDSVSTETADEVSKDDSCYQLPVTSCTVTSHRENVDDEKSNSTVESDGFERENCEEFSHQETGNSLVCSVSGGVNESMNVTAVSNSQGVVSQSASDREELTNYPLEYSKSGVSAQNVDVGNMTWKEHSLPVSVSDLQSFYTASGTHTLGGVSSFSGFNSHSDSLQQATTSSIAVSSPILSVSEDSFNVRNHEEPTSRVPAQYRGSDALMSWINNPFLPKNGLNPGPSAGRIYPQMKPSSVSDPLYYAGEQEANVLKNFTQWIASLEDENEAYASVTAFQSGHHGSGRFSYGALSSLESACSTSFPERESPYSKWQNRSRENEPDTQNYGMESAQQESQMSGNYLSEKPAAPKSQSHFCPWCKRHFTYTANFKKHLRELCPLRNHSVSSNTCNEILPRKSAYHEDVYSAQKEVASDVVLIPLGTSALPVNKPAIPLSIAKPIITLTSQDTVVTLSSETILSITTQNISVSSKPPSFTISNNSPISSTISPHYEPIIESEMLDDPSSGSDDSGSVSLAPCLDLTCREKETGLGATVNENELIPANSVVPLVESSTSVLPRPLVPSSVQQSNGPSSGGEYTLLDLGSSGGKSSYNSKRVQPAESTETTSGEKSVGEGFKYMDPELAAKVLARTAATQVTVSEIGLRGNHLCSVKIPSFPCPTCYKVFFSRFEMMKHRLSHSLGIAKDVPVKRRNMKNFPLILNKRKIGSDEANYSKKKVANNISNLFVDGNNVFVVYQKDDKITLVKNTLPGTPENLGQAGSSRMTFNTLLTSDFLSRVLQSEALFRPSFMNQLNQFNEFSLWTFSNQKAITATEQSESCTQLAPFVGCTASTDTTAPAINEGNSPQLLNSTSSANTFDTTVEGATDRDDPSTSTEVCGDCPEELEDDSSSYGNSMCEAPYVNDTRQEGEVGSEHNGDHLQQSTEEVSCILTSELLPMEQMENTESTVENHHLRPESDCDKGRKNADEHLKTTPDIIIAPTIAAVCEQNQDNAKNDYVELVPVCVDELTPVSSSDEQKTIESSESSISVNEVSHLKETGCELKSTRAKLQSNDVKELLVKKAVCPTTETVIEIGNSNPVSSDLETKNASAKTTAVKELGKAVKVPRKRRLKDSSLKSSDTKTAHNNKTVEKHKLKELSIKLSPLCYNPESKEDCKYSLVKITDEKLKPVDSFHGCENETDTLDDRIRSFAELLAPDNEVENDPFNYLPGGSSPTVAETTNSFQSKVEVNESVLAGASSPSDSRIDSKPEFPEKIVQRLSATLEEERLAPKKKREKKKDSDKIVATKPVSSKTVKRAPSKREQNMLLSNTYPVIQANENCSLKSVPDALKQNSKKKLPLNFDILDLQTFSSVADDITTKPIPMKKPRSPKLCSSNTREVKKVDHVLPKKVKSPRKNNGKCTGTAAVDKAVNMTMTQYAPVTKKSKLLRTGRSSPRKKQSLDIPSSPLDKVITKAETTNTNVCDILQVESSENRQMPIISDASAVQKKRRIRKVDCATMPTLIDMRDTQSSTKVDNASTIEKTEMDDTNVPDIMQAENIKQIIIPSDASVVQKKRRVRKVDCATVPTLIDMRDAQPTAKSVTKRKKKSKPTFTTSNVFNMINDHLLEAKCESFAKTKGIKSQLSSKPCDLSAVGKNTVQKTNQRRPHLKD